MKKFTRLYTILFLTLALPVALFAQTSVSMPVNVSGAMYTATASGVSPQIGTITVTLPVGSQYTYSLDGGTYQSSAVFSGLAGGSTHSISVKTTANGTLSLTPTITVPLCDNDISTGTGTIVRMMYDNTGSSSASYNWCAREVTGPDGLQWLDRNLGAYRVATSATDAQSYGSLYQWGRSTDGHQIAGGTRGVDATTASPTTTTQAISDVPGNNSYIMPNSDYPSYDWRSDHNTNRWNLTSGSGATFMQANNPCPAGYHVPTQVQLAALISNGGWTNGASAFNSALKMPLTGFRLYANGSLITVGSAGYFWSSTAPSNNTLSPSLNIGTNSIGTEGYSAKSSGFSVRCIKN